MDQQSSPTLSPFYEEAVQSSLLKKRPSKRIKKIANSIYKNKTLLSKTCRDQDQNKIISILAQRNVPEFLIDFVKKKRIFNMGSIRKIAIIKNDQNFMPSTSLFLSRQENELQQILDADKLWKEERKKFCQPSQALPLMKKASIDTQAYTTFSTFSEDVYSCESEIQHQEAGKFSFQYADVSPFEQGSFDEPLSLMMSRSVGDSDLFLRMF